MAGYVPAHLEVHGDRSFDLMPDACPATDEHTSGTPRCHTIHGDGWNRACLYYVTSCAANNVTERVHVSVLSQRMPTLVATQMRCGVICQRQRGNRPPGC